MLTLSQRVISLYQSGEGLPHRSLSEDWQVYLILYTNIYIYMRAQVIDLDPETNPKLKEILDLLLLAGYFRIRIPSITPFDKVFSFSIKILGGLSWCITQSNFAIDIQYSEEFNIGQKIKVSEKIVKSLEEMSSPYKLQPHQI